MMTNCLTLSGLRQLRLMQRKKQELPTGWERGVYDYINRRQIFSNLHDSRWRKEQLSESKRIAKLMGVRL